MLLHKLSDQWRVNGTPIYAPDTCSVDNDSIVSSDSGTTESGHAYITWIRPELRKVRLTYKYITGEEVAYLHNLMQGKEFHFTYLDNGLKTLYGYAKKDSYAPYNLDAYQSEGGLYKNYTIDIHEM